MGGRRRPKKPQAKWLGEVNKDVRLMGTRKLWPTSVDKEEWNRLLTEAQESEEF
jgi:hypothetical protein